jgi:F-type H+-transporting ATPase subunit delta
MIYSPKTIAQAIYNSAKDKDGIELKHVLDNTVVFLKKNKLLSKYKEILKHLQNISDYEEKIVRAQVTTTDKLGHKLKEELEEILKKRYKAKDVEIENIEDPNLIGGIKLEIKDEVIDLSFAHKLYQLQKYLIKN